MSSTSGSSSTFRSAPARVARVDLPHRAWLAICSGLHAVAQHASASPASPAPNSPAGCWISPPNSPSSSLHVSQVVVLDNASIHKSHEFVRMVNQCGGIVLFLPPYCFDLTPLDNGAFGLARRWLMANEKFVYSEGMRSGSDRAFESVSSRCGRTAQERECGRRSARCFFSQLLRRCVCVNTTSPLLPFYKPSHFSRSFRFLLSSPR